MASGDVIEVGETDLSPGQSFGLEVSGGRDWLRTDTVELAEELLRSAQRWPHHRD